MTTIEEPITDTRTALAHFQRKLELETDPYDVYMALKNGDAGILVLDARAPELYAEAHIPGAINLPHRRIDAETTAALPRDKVIVTYCDGIGCNASTKAAAKLSSLGFRVKEMMGGIDWWRYRDGFPVHSATEAGETASRVSCGC